MLTDPLAFFSSDIHVLMMRAGCEVMKVQDGTFKFVKGVYEYGYDGINFLSFDDTLMQWEAHVPAALLTKNKWNGVPILNQYAKGYLEKECVDWLDKFIKYGDLELTDQQAECVYFYQWHYFQST